MIFSTKKAVFTALVVLIAIGSIENVHGKLGNDAPPERKLVPDNYEIKDNPTPKARMNIVVNQLTLDYEMDIQLEDFTFAPQLMTELSGCVASGFEIVANSCEYNNGDRDPNSGHLHLYIGKRGPSGAYETIGFGTPMTGQQSGNLCDAISLINESYTVSNGDEILVLLEIEHNDHTRRTKFAPRNFPPIDIFTFIKRGASVTCS